MAKRAGIVVEEFNIGYPPRATKLGQRKGTLYYLNWLPIGSFIKMLGEKDASIPNGFASKSKPARLSVLIIGPILSLMIMIVFMMPAIVFFILAYVSGATEPVTGININGQEASTATTVITYIEPFSPAEEVGLQAGDIVVGVDESEVKYVDDLVSYVGKMEGEEITLHIKRGEQMIEIPITPRVNPPEGQGRLGVHLNYEDVRSEIIYYPLPDAFVKGVVSAFEWSWRTVYMPLALTRDIIQDDEVKSPRFQNNLIWPSETVEATRWYPPFFVLGILSASVTFPIILATAISLLPLPGWDNWRIIALIFQG